MPAVIDRPPVEAPRTEPAPERRRPSWRFPWNKPKTRIAAPTEDDELLIDNRTDQAWTLHLGYRSLGRIEPHAKLLVHVVKTGMLTARPVNAPVGVGYLTAFLTGEIETVEIRGERMGGEHLYDLQLLTTRRGRSKRVGG